MTTIRLANPEDHPAIIALQHAAYAQNRVLLGVEPLPLQADYDSIFARYETWVATNADGIAGALILEWRPQDLLIWSIATQPRARAKGIGNRLLAHAEECARQRGKNTIRLYTGEALTENVAWYGRHGFAIERVEQMPDRRAVHMKKIVGGDEWQDDSQARPPS